jgi:hypothetical protein
MNISDKFVYNLCKSTDSTLPNFASEKHLILIARLDSYLKINKNSELKVSYDEFIEILRILNLKTKIYNYQLPYLVNSKVINRDILHQPSDWDTEINNLID